MYVNDDLDDIAYTLKRTFRFSQAADADRKKVVVLGSGWGALSFVKKLDPELYDVTVVSPRPFFFYTPLLCGSTTGTVSPGAIIEPIRDSAPGCSYLHVVCRDVDLEAKKVFCSGTGSDVALDYDHLVVAVGAQPNTFGIPGVDKHAMFLKEIEHGREVRKQFLDRVEQADVALAAGQLDRVKQLLNVVVVGGGPTGVEFCGELSDFIKKDLVRQFPRLREHFQATLVEALPGLLTMFQKAVGEHVQEHLVNQGVDVRLNAMVKEAHEKSVQIKLKDGTVQTIDFGTLVWVAGVGMRPFTKQLCQKIGADAGQTDRRGLLVDECLRVKGTRLGEVFAIGDCAVSGKPPTAQVAAQQGKYLGRMFRAGNEDSISDDSTKGFAYSHQGTMAYIGDSKAATELFPNGLIKLGRSSITDHLWWRSLYGECDHVRVMGLAGFAVWRSVYFSKMYSSRGRWSVASDWMRTSFFGRPASTSAQGTATIL
eukprot:CAMPEP_0117486266 /NCGR_PEP_ID=MMETSP0784-20121206/15388_1 /TAXON_ID=39447 /ORGANISM="" /LENGTH=481 /DNA_ID=CAMNT_0005280871 /DNA_START=1 /DNA_END=1446 /DNA_ORIENTATION=-